MTKNATYAIFTSNYTKTNNQRNAITMNDAESKIKQQVIEKIKASSNILVTVSRNPSVDDLTALLGLTAIMNKQGKHATAIFSGDIPPAINFLNPKKVIENTADSLRDFIIALDKEKADHLRYKIEGDMVKIFITPYRTTITSEDLDFSQGDLNVELVLALGVENKDHLDSVLTSQNGIFNDATIITFSDGVRTSDLGTIDWNDKNASCLSEMIFNLAESFKSEKERTVLDKQISTALLTGIVSATDRFSNIRTTARVMTVSAQLIGAGADPQSISAKLQEAHEIQELAPEPAVTSSITSTEIDMPAELDAVPVSTLPPEQKDNLVIDHSESPDDTESTVSPDISTIPDEEAVNTLPVESFVESSEEPTISTMPPQAEVKPISSSLPVIEPLSSAESFQESVSTVAPEAISEPNSGTTSEPSSTLNSDPALPQPSADILESAEPSKTPEDIIQDAIDSMKKNAPAQPVFGGTLNATAEQASEDNKRELEDDRNKTTLSHSYMDEKAPDSQSVAPINSASQSLPEEKSVDIFNETPQSSLPPEPIFSSMPVIQPPTLDSVPPPPSTPDLLNMMPPSIVSSFDAELPPSVSEQLPPAPDPSSSMQTPISDPSQYRIPGQ